MRLNTNQYVGLTKAFMGLINKIAFQFNAFESLASMLLKW